MRATGGKIWTPQGLLPAICVVVAAHPGMVYCQAATQGTTSVLNDTTTISNAAHRTAHRRSLPEANAAGCDVDGFVLCAGVNLDSYTTGCCSGVEDAEDVQGCTASVNHCYFCGQGGARCFMLNAATEAGCLSRHGCIFCEAGKHRAKD